MCKTSQTVWTSSLSSSSTSKKYDNKDFIACQTRGVVYLLSWTYGFQHGWMTCRALSVSVCEHLNNIRKGSPSHSVSKHFDQYHYRNPASLWVLGIEKYSPHWRVLLSKDKYPGRGLRVHGDGRLSSELCHPERHKATKQGESAAVHSH